MPEQKRSPAYPSFDLNKAMEYVRNLASRERLQSVPLDVAATGLGYKGLSGSSRAVFATLKQYGFIAYQSDGGKVSLLVFTDLARDLVQPIETGEETSVVRKAFQYPRIYKELESAFPEWDLPSEDNLHNRLCRHYRFGDDAAKDLQKVLRRNLEIIRALPPESGAEEESDDSRSDDPPTDPANRTPIGERGAVQPPNPRQGSGGMRAPILQHLIMPGSDVYLAMPRTLDGKTGRRMLRWLNGVAVPAIQFAMEEPEVEEPEVEE